MFSAGTHSLHGRLGGAFFAKLPFETKQAILEECTGTSGALRATGRRRRWASSRTAQQGVQRQLYILCRQPLCMHRLCIMGSAVPYLSMTMTIKHHRCAPCGDTVGGTGLFHGPGVHTNIPRGGSGRLDSAPGTAPLACNRFRSQKFPTIKKNLESDEEQELSR
jgi:hypothetical protein